MVYRIVTVGLQGGRPATRRPRRCADIGDGPPASCPGWSMLRDNLHDGTLLHAWRAAGWVGYCLSELAVQTSRLIKQLRDPAWREGIHLLRLHLLPGRGVKLPALAGRGNERCCRRTWDLSLKACCVDGAAPVTLQTDGFAAPAAHRWHCLVPAVVSSMSPAWLSAVVAVRRW